jgi:hypothetical protein
MELTTIDTRQSVSLKLFIFMELTTIYSLSILNSLYGAYYHRQSISLKIFVFILLTTIERLSILNSFNL